MSRQSRLAWRALTAAVAAIIMGLAMGVSAEAKASAEQLYSADSAASAGIMDDYIRINSIYVKSDRSVRISVTTKKAIPSPAGASLSWRYPSATRNNGDFSVRSISRSPGTRNYFLTGVPKRMMSLRIMKHFTAIKYSESSTYWRHVGPSSTSTYTNSVSKAEAAALAVTMHIPGAILTFGPGRAIKFAGGAVLGWSVWSDVKTAVSGKTSGCRKLRAGDYVVTNSKSSADGSYTKVQTRTRVFTSYTAYAKKNKPVCDTGYYTQARYR